MASNLMDTPKGKTRMFEEEVMKLPGMGFWSSEESSSKDRKEILSKVRQLTDAELATVFLYMGNSRRAVAYMGDAYCRLCKNEYDSVDHRLTGWHLGSQDMLTPDKKWRFPEGWEHYITVHGVAPDQPFITAASAWREERNIG